MHVALFLSALVAVVAASGLARAQAPAPSSARAEPSPLEVSIRLHLVLGRGAQRCPDEARLRREVGREIGYDPFEPGTKRSPAGQLSVEIAAKDGALIATYNYVGEDGAPKWAAPKTYREQGTSTESCIGVMKGMAVALAWELTVFAPPPPASSPAVPPPVPLPLPEPPKEQVPTATPPAPPSMSWHPRVEVGLAAVVAGGLAPPAVSVGGVLHLGAAFFPMGRERTGFSFAGEGRADTASASSAMQYTTRTNSLVGSLLVCGHTPLAVGTVITWSILYCGLGTAGSMTVLAESMNGSASDQHPYVGLGLRSGLEAAIKSPVAIRVQGEGLGKLYGAHTATKGDGDASGTSAIAGGANLGAVVFF
jgi:hypothetical protein